MRNQSRYSNGQPSSPPIIGFLKRNLPIVVFLVMSFLGMVLVYWYFSPEDAEAEAASVASALTNDEGALSAPIHKTVPEKPVSQRLVQSPGPIRIGIIAGHKGFDSGAVCPDGLTEAQVNDNIADMVLSDLQAEGIRAEKLDEFDARLDGYTATAVLSIHADSCDYINDLATGFKVSGSGYTNSGALSICVEDAYRNATQMFYHANTITPDMTDYHVFRKLGSTTQAVIIEVGFMNLDREMITTNAAVPAQGITDGLLCFVNQYKQNKAIN